MGGMAGMGGGGEMLGCLGSDLIFIFVFFYGFDIELGSGGIGLWGRLHDGWKFEVDLCIHCIAFWV